MIPDQGGIMATEGQVPLTREAAVEAAGATIKEITAELVRLKGDAPPDANPEDLLEGLSAGDNRVLTAGICRHIQDVLRRCRDIAEAGKHDSADAINLLNTVGPQLVMALQATPR
jgi:hypothetical protein